MFLTFEQYVEEAERSFKAQRFQRRGQYFFNTLHDIRPDITADLCGSDVDCFYRDVLIIPFLQEVENRW